MWNDEKNTSELVTKEGLGEVRNEFQSTSMMNTLVKEMENLQAVNHALWELMKLRGYTDDEFNAALAGVLELRKHKDYDMNKNIVCPNCGKSLQYSNSFKIKCIYCGTTMVMNPYQKYNAIIEKEFDNSEPVQAEYNIEDDLRFDEL